MKSPIFRSLGVLLAAGVTLGVLGLTAVPAIGHQSDDDGKVTQGQRMTDQGTMDRGMMHRRMMSRSMMRHSMMGYGKSGGHHRDYLGANIAERNFSISDVTKILESRLVWRGNPRLKLGKVTEKDENTIIAEIVTVDDSLVQRLSVDRKTGHATRIN